MRQTPKVFEVQERARGPLSPCQVWWGSDFTHRPGRPKTLSFFVGLSVCLSVCLSVRHALEQRRFCVRFCSEGVGVQKRFWCRWIGEEGL